MKIYEAWEALKVWAAQERDAADGMCDPSWNAYQAVIEKIGDLEEKYE